MPRRGRCVAVACACVVLALCLLTHRVTEAAPPEGPCRGVFAAAAWCDMGKSTDERIALLIGALPLADKIGMLGSAIDHPAGYSNATGVPSYQVLPRRGTHCLPDDCHASSQAHDDVSLAAASPAAGLAKGAAKGWEKVKEEGKGGRTPS